MRDRECEICRQSRQAFASAFMHMSGFEITKSRNCRRMGASEFYSRPYPLMNQDVDLENPAFRHYPKDQRGSFSPNHRFRILKIRDNSQMHKSPFPFCVILKEIIDRMDSSLVTLGFGLSGACTWEPGHYYH